MPEQAFSPPHTSEGSMTATQTPFQGQLVLLKIMLESAKEKLSEREWAALRACLLIYLQAEEDREGA